MGIGNYFKANKGAAPAAAPRSGSVIQMSEKPAGGPPAENFEMRKPGTAPKFGSSRASLAPSTRSSTFVDDIKHEVMCNYLYQQQCSRLWVSDGSGELEGVLLRKSRNNYISCPPQLVESPFAQACAALNCQVSALTHVSSQIVC